MRVACPQSRFATALLAVGVAAAHVACASGTPEVKAPDEAAVAGAPGTSSEAARPSAAAEYTPQVSSAAVQARRESRPKLQGAALQSYEAGWQAFRAGDLQGAKQQFLRVTQADKNAYQAYHALGLVHERLGSPSEASSAYRAALRVVPDYEAAILAQASLLMRTGQTAEAEQFLNGKHAEFPDSAAALTGLSELKSIQKDSAAAQQYAQQALKKDPGFRPAMVALARDHYRNRRLDLALYALVAILDGYGPENPPRDKNNGEARLLRALIYKEQGRRADAISEFAKAVELRPDLVEARINLAAYYLEAGNAIQAVPILEEALRYDASNVLIHLNLGDAYRLQGRPAEAIKQLDWVAKKDRTLAQAHYNLGLVYLFSAQVPGLTDAQRIDSAIAEFETYQKMQPRGQGGEGDDVDDLLKRAKNKKAVMEAMNAGGDDEFE